MSPAKPYFAVKTKPFKVRTDSKDSPYEYIFESQMFLCLNVTLGYGYLSSYQDSV